MVNKRANVILAFVLVIVLALMSIGVILGNTVKADNTDQLVVTYNEDRTRITVSNIDGYIKACESKDMSEQDIINEVYDNLGYTEDEIRKNVSKDLDSLARKSYISISESYIELEEDADEIKTKVIDKEEYYEKKASLSVMPVADLLPADQEQSWRDNGTADMKVSSKNNYLKVRLSASNSYYGMNGETDYYYNKDEKTHLANKYRYRITSSWEYLNPPSSRMTEHMILGWDGSIVNVVDGNVGYVTKPLAKYQGNSYGLYSDNITGITDSSNYYYMRYSYRPSEWFVYQPTKDYVKDAGIELKENSMSTEYHLPFDSTGSLAGFNTEYSDFYFESSVVVENNTSQPHKPVNFKISTGFAHEYIGFSGAISVSYGGVGVSISPKYALDIFKLSVISADTGAYSDWIYGKMN